MEVIKPSIINFAGETFIQIYRPDQINIVNPIKMITKQFDNQTKSIYTWIRLNTFMYKLYLTNKSYFYQESNTI